MTATGTNGGGSAGFRFRVSDALPVPLRGYMLRLRLLSGAPKVGALEPGKRLRLVAPDGGSREVEVQAFSLTGGRATQAELDKKRELDVVISEADAMGEGRPVAIGWLAVGD